MNTNENGVLLRKDGQPDKRSLKRRAPNDRTFTVREQQVVTQIAQGTSNADIARSLGISEKTVSTHRDSALKKLGTSGFHVRGDSILTLHAVRQGWVRP